MRTVSDLASLDLAGLAAWTAVAGDPPARTGHSLAFDPSRGVVHLFGGTCDSTGSGYGSTMTNTLWGISSGADAPAWTPENSGGGPLLPRRDAALAVDPARDRLLLFGGTNGNQMTNEVWQRPLSGSPAWSRVAIGGTLPRQRANAAMVYDPDGDRLLMFGGYDYGSGSSAYLADLWALSLGGSPAWTRLLPSGVGPAARSDGWLAFDPIRHCAYLFCGRGSNYYGGDPLRANEVWQLTLAPGPAWQRLADGDEYGYSVTDVTCAGFYDAAQGALVRAAYFYDYNNYGSTAQARVSLFHPGADTSWSARACSGAPPQASVDARGVFDPQSRRLLWFGGFEPGAEGTWALSFGEPPLDVPPGVADASRPLRIAPNPARGACAVRFALARPGRVSLELLDLAGRRVRGPVAADLPAGPAELRLADLSALPAGVYFARLAGALERQARVAVVH